MKKIILSTALLLAFVSNAQDANNFYPKKIKFEAKKAPNFVEGKVYTSANLNQRLVSGEKAPEVELIRVQKDNLGYEHYRYQQKYNGIPVIGADIVQHVKSGKLLSQTGYLVRANYLSRSLKGKTQRLTEAQALTRALDLNPGAVYKWQVEKEEEILKKIKKDPKATYYPKGELVYYNRGSEFDAGSLRLAYRFNVYAHKPLFRKMMYIDAATGDLLGSNDEIKTLYGEGSMYEAKVKHVHPHHNNGFSKKNVTDRSTSTKGNAQTMYSGLQEIYSQYVPEHQIYRLYDDTRAGGIWTLNLNYQDNPNDSDEFANNDSNWDAGGHIDGYALDAHWGAEVVYDFYQETYDRNSIDGRGMQMVSFIHLGQGVVNAFWSGEFMMYGDGNGRDIKPLTALEIVGHEFTHGVTQHTSNLQYRGQSGALNEAYSDILGIAIEKWKKGRNNWLMGDEIGLIFRDMAHPKNYQNPNTYQGDFWLKTEGCYPNDQNDQCGVHINSGVLNYWFYLLCQGGSGTNDHGTKYSVKPIGVEKAASIAYRTNAYKLGASSNYADATEASIESAIELFGKDSEELKQVKNAFIAVGLINPDELCEDPNVEVIVKTDGSPYQTNWVIKKDGQTVLKNEEYSDSYNTYSHKLCMEDGCYTFEMKDSGGNGLTSGYFEVKVKGKSVFKGSNDFTYSTSKEFCTDGVPEDTENPTAPKNLEASNITETTVDLVWGAATDNIDVVKYNVYMDGKLLGSVDKLQVTVSELEPGTRHDFTITAVDAAGNESYKSNKVYVTLKKQEAEVDREKPSTPGSIQISDVTSNSVSISWGESTDNVGVEGYNIYHRYTKLKTVDAKTTYAHLTDLKPNTFYGFTIEAFDKAGNVSYKGYSEYITTESALSVEDVTEQDKGFTVYPSPVAKNGEITVKATKLEKGKIEIVNVLGVVVKTQNFKGDSAKVNLTGIQSGLYLVRISDGNKQLVKKVMIK